MANDKKIIKFLVIFLVFLFAFSIRVFNLDKMGRTWDEGAQIELGYKAIELIKNGNFSSPSWLYPDHPPLTKYLYGLAAKYDVKEHRNGNPIFNYDWTHARYVSVVFSSMTSVLVLLIGWSYFSLLIGIIAAVIFSMLPFFLGLSQLATIESILVFFFTVSVYYFLRLLDKPNFKNILLTGIMVGLAIGTKYTNILLIPLFFWIYFLWLFYKKKGKGKLLNIKILLIFPIAFFAFFVLWPMSWFHIKDIFGVIYKMRVVDASHSVPEVFFGRLMLVPIFYYIIQFLITTPFIILVLFLIGLKNITSKKTWIMYSIIAWFVLPFIQSFYNFRQHGVRYIVEIYVPLSIIAAIGFDFTVSYFTKKQSVKFLLFFPIFIYMSIILLRISPYYLDYFNVFVGGTKNVYEKRLFQLGWWGQGIGEAGDYLAKNAPPGAKIGLAISPIVSFPQLTQFKISIFNQNERYDYVVVNYYNVLREGFDDSIVKITYKPVYFVKADGAILAAVYKHK